MLVMRAPANMRISRRCGITCSVGLLHKLDRHDRRAGPERQGSRLTGQAERRVTYGLVAVVALLFLAYGVLMALNGRHDRRVADQLRSEGVTVDATITDHRVPYQLKGAHEVKVEFQTVSGQQVDTWVTVSDYESPGPTRVRYSEADPSVARLTQDMEPRAGDLLALIIITLALGSLGYMVYRIGKGFDRTLGVDG